MDFVRIGDKIISQGKVAKAIKEMFDLRAQGYSQLEVAQKYNLDRSFVSRLEKLGEVRKGKKIAVIGFPVLNKEEVLKICSQESVDYTLIMTEKERWDFLKKKSGLELFDNVMQHIFKIREHEVVILLMSDKRARLVGGILEGEVLHINLGPSPLSEDQYIGPEHLRALIKASKEE
ncbi:MAG: transcriptional regulator [Peptococcaceae bacterium]